MRYGGREAAHLRGIHAEGSVDTCEEGVGGGEEKGGELEWAGGPPKDKRHTRAGWQWTGCPNTAALSTSAKKRAAACMCAVTLVLRKKMSFCHRA